MIASTKTEIGRTKLETYLISNKIKQVDLVAKVKKKYPDEPISSDTMSRIVSGNREIGIKTLRRLCAVLDLTPNDILDI